MDEPSGYRRWDDLIPDALGLVFRNLPLQEILTVVPRVCKSWNKVVAGPYCWQEIDVEEWSSSGDQGEKLDRMLRLLITRSSGSLRSLSFSYLNSEPTFSFLAEHSGSLRTLRMANSEIPESVVERLASRLSAITYLDVSYCGRIGASGLAAIGRNCRALWGLCRNMHPQDAASRATQDEEAHAIAESMPNLTHLEVAYLVISTESVLRVLSGCPKLELLDLRGCWHVKIDENFMRESFPRLKTLGPIVVGYYEQVEWDDDCSDFSDYLSWEFVAGDVAYFHEHEDDDSFDGEDRLQLRFYEPFEGGMLHEWPASP